MQCASENRYCPARVNEIKNNIHISPGLMLSPAFSTQFEEREFALVPLSKIDNHGTVDMDGIRGGF